MVESKINWWLIAIVIAIILLIPKLTNVGPTVQINTSGTSGGATGAVGGGGGAGTPTGMNWPDFSDLFNWKMPCFFNCGGSGTSGESESKSCTSNSQCSSGTHCELGNKAIGTCVQDISVIECSRDTDCTNICSNPNYAHCSNGKCDCSIPNTPASTITCSDTDVSRDYSDGKNWLSAGACSTTITRTVSDYCGHGLLVEYYCRGTECVAEDFDCSTLGHGYTCIGGSCGKN